MRISKLPPELEQLVRKVFLELPPIHDDELCRRGFDVSTSENQILRVFRGRGRFDLVGSSEYLDPEALIRMSGYARWYFAPTFMLRAGFENLHSDFSELLYVFGYSERILEEFGIDPGATVGRGSFAVEALDPMGIIRSLSVQACLPQSEPDVPDWSLQHFCQSACYFSAVEKKVVAQFLRWLEAEAGNEAGYTLALNTFWRA